MSDRKVAIRLATDGSQEVKQDLKSIGDTGKQSFDGIGQAAEAGARRAQQAFERATGEIQSAQQRQANAAAKIAAITPQTSAQFGINQSVGTGFGDYEGSAKRSAAAFRELIAEQDRMEAKAKAIKAALDPLTAATDRYNQEIEETKRLQQAGLLTAAQSEVVQKRLTEAFNRERTALTQVNAVSGAARAGAQQLGFQISDVATQFTAGTAPMIIFAQQGNQVVQALALMKGGATGFLGFMAGPWGAVLMGAIGIIGVFVSNMGEAEDATEGLTEAQKSGVLAADALTAATKALDDMTGRVKLSQEEATVQAALLTRQRLEQARATWIATAAEVELLRTQRDQANADAVGGRALNYGAYGVVDAFDSHLDAAQKRLDAVGKAIDEAQAAIAVAGNGGNFAGRFLDRGRYEGRIGARPDPKDPNAASGKEAERSARALQSSLEGLERQFDPTASAGRKYVDVLAEIDKLQKAGKLDAETATSYRVKAALSRFDDERKSAEDALAKAGQKQLADGRTIADYWDQMSGGSLIDEQALARSLDGLDKLSDKAKYLGGQFVDVKAIGIDALQSILDVRRFDDFGRVGSVVLDTLKRKFLELALVNPLTNLLSGGAPGFQALPTLFGLFKGGHAAGSEYFGGGLAMVGEFGRELVSLPRGSRITPAGQTRRMMEAANDRGGVFNFDLRGAVMTEDLLKQMNAMADGAAVRGAAGGAMLGQVQLRKRARFRMA